MHIIKWAQAKWKMMLRKLVCILILLHMIFIIVKWSVRIILEKVPMTNRKWMGQTYYHLYRLIAYQTRVSSLVLWISLRIDRSNWKSVLYRFVYAISIRIYLLYIQLQPPINIHNTYSFKALMIFFLSSLAIFPFSSMLCVVCSWVLKMQT